jgi:hypothetical protein
MGGIDDTGQVDVDGLDVGLAKLCQDTPNPKSVSLRISRRLIQLLIALTKIGLGEEHLRVRLSDPGVRDDYVQMFAGRLFRSLFEESHL